MDLIIIAMVVARRFFYGRKPLLQTGNLEWVTAIESILATVFSLSLCIIFKGSTYNIDWATGLPGDW